MKHLLESRSSDAGSPRVAAGLLARIRGRRPLIVDTKNLLDSARLRAMGYEYVGVGRG